MPRFDETLFRINWVHHKENSKILISGFISDRKELFNAGKWSVESFERDDKGSSEIKNEVRYDAEQA